MLDPFAAHRAGGEGADRVAEAFRRNPKHLRHGDGGQQIGDRVAAGEAGFVIHSQSAKARAIGPVFHVFGAHIGGFGKAERDGAAAM